MEDEASRQKRLILHMINELGQEAYEKLMERISEISEQSDKGDLPEEDGLVQAFDNLFREFDIKPPPEDLINEEVTIDAQIALLTKYDDILANPLGIDSMTISSVEYGLRSWLPESLKRRARNDEECQTLMEMNDAYINALICVKTFRRDMSIIDDTLLMLSPSLWRHGLEDGIDDDPGGQD